MARILVLYGTGEGHTRLIAHAIGETLTNGGFEVDIMDAVESREGFERDVIGHEDAL